MGLTVREEPYAIEQWRADAESGRLTEAFACGTAAVVTAIGSVKSAEGGFAIGGQSVGPVTQRIRETPGRHPARPGARSAWLDRGATRLTRCPFQPGGARL